MEIDPPTIRIECSEGLNSDSSRRIVVYGVGDLVAGVGGGKRLQLLLLPTIGLRNAANYSGTNLGRGQGVVGIRSLPVRRFNRSDVGIVCGAERVGLNCSRTPIVDALLKEGKGQDL